jgi:hypothetical protein
MKTETRILEDTARKVSPAPEELPSRLVLISPQYPARKIAAVVAVVSSDLRISSEKTTETMKRMLVTLSMTAERVAWSRAAIASSRCLLKTPRHLTESAFDASPTIPMSKNNQEQDAAGGL